MSSSPSLFGSATSSSPIALSCKDIQYSVEIRKWFGLRHDHTKHILKGISARFEPQQLTAIIGGSGSGKTSLLDVLAGRVRMGKVVGDVILNGSVIPSSSLLSTIKPISGYVSQHDHLLANLTVKETIYYAALLRLGRDMTKKQKTDQADRVINELRLRHCVNSKIGDTFTRGISGGEKRRVSIAIQLLSNPSLLFLDEPTSGLDSTTAYHLIRLLARLCVHGRTVICSIHQPRSDIYHLFNTILILSHGNVIYNGETEKLVSYLQEKGYPCPKYTNPADYALDLITIDTRTKEREIVTTERLETFIEHYHKEREASLSSFPISSSSSTSLAIKAVSSLSSSISSPSFFSQFLVLTERACKSVVRDKLSFMSKLFYSVFIALVFGGISYNLGNDQTGVQDRIGTLNILLSLTPFMAILAAIVQWQKERAVFTRERNDGLYSPLPFFFSKLISELPIDIILNFCFCIICYTMVGLHKEVSRFIIFYLLILLLIVTSQSFGYLFSSLIPDLLAATTAANSAFTVFFLPSGWVIPYAAMNSAFSWLKDISYLKYGYVALSINEFSDSTFYCTQTQLQESLGICPFTTGEEVIDFEGMSGESITTNSIVILCILIALKIAFYLIIRFKSQSPK